jgi:hypothetical protein
MLLALIYQLHLTHSHLIRVKDLRMRYPIRNSVPIKELVSLLLEICNDFDRVIVLVDALDECEDVQELYDALKGLVSQKRQNKTIQILVSSRDEIAIQQALLSISFERYPPSLMSVHNDLELYIREQVLVDPTRRFTRFPDSLKAEIVESLCSQSQGMYVAALNILPRSWTNESAGSDGLDVNWMTCPGNTPLTMFDMRSETCQRH